MHTPQPPICRGRVSETSRDDADGGHDRSLEVMAGRGLQPTATNDPLSG
jgi:hypothetical protein